MDIDEEIDRQFQYIRNTFFPKWDRKHEWKVKRVWDLPFDGRYDNNSKTILISSGYENPDILHRWLIHELCHCASLHHGKRWQTRLTKAMEKAKILGRKVLAEEIEKELSLYKSSDFVPNHRKVYSQIYEAVFLDSPKITWHNLLKFIAQENGMYPKEFLKRFKRAKEIYLEAKKDLRDKKKARKNFEEVTKGGEPA